MKTRPNQLELGQYGLTEMDAQEMKATNGGSLVAIGGGLKTVENYLRAIIALTLKCLIEVLEPFIEGTAG